MRFLGFLLLVSVLASSLASAAPMTSNSVTMPKSSSTGAHGVNEVPEGKSPITGLDYQGDYRPLVVQISNSPEARPHWNLSEADIVYESIVWGPAYTRYTAIYHDNHPDLVGPVRSARLHHCELRQEWDAPFVFWGGQEEAGTSIGDFFKQYDVKTAFLISGAGNFKHTSSKALGRASDRVSPHNAIANLQQVIAENWPTKDDGSPYSPRVHAYKFSTTPSRGVDDAVEIRVPYDEKNHYNPSYTYNASKRVYERWYNGEEEIDGKTGKRIEASNVIIQYTETSYAGGSYSRPVISTVKGGIMDAFIDGRHIRGTWDRAAMGDRTVFLDMNGEEITMLPGKTFIQIIPNNMSFTYVRADGTEITMESGSTTPEVKLEDDGAADLDKME